MNQNMLSVVHEKRVSMHDGSWPDIKSIQEEDEFQIIDKKARRKSWHAIKFEKKRRKGSSVGLGSGEGNSPPPARREKRGSWWNIFAGNQPRSRRASQDVTKITKEFPWTRSKSRSVDHGITSPYDIASLRAKVDSHVLGSSGELDGSTNSLSERRRTGPPENTTTYTVADRDTLTSVAARFDTTPSELTKLNRLATPYIFPGQQLYVPLREDAQKEESEGSTPVEDIQDDLPLEEKELLENLRPVSPKPGHVERVRIPSHAQSVTSETEDEPTSVFRERFLKINVRHITDGEGVVAGVLLVTPNAVMFDPNVSDPLVIDKGPEAYGVIAPMEFVVNVAIYTDIAHMRVSHAETVKTPEKAEIYYPKNEKDVDHSLAKDSTEPELVGGTDDAESICSCTEREGDAFPKAFDRDLVTPTNLETNHPGDDTKSLEERRKSLLDHHWPMTSQERKSIDVDEMPAITPTAEEGPQYHLDERDEELIEDLVKQSCHDSGIDITESLPPIPIVPIVPAKKQYSDADIVLSKDWVPPVTIAPITPHHSSLSESDSPARKKTQSVSFSLDSSGGEGENLASQLSNSFIESKEDAEKADTRKNKMLKRLSYPLSWMDTLGGDKDDEKSSSQPNTGDAQHSSVFSKVFSSSPIHLDFRTSLFAKTPSEDSGSSGEPRSASSGGPLTGDSGSSFFPSNIISSMGASVGAMGEAVGAMGAQVGGQVVAIGSTVGSTVGAIGSQVGEIGAQVGASVSAVGRASVGTVMRQSTDGSSGSKKKEKQAKEAPAKLDYRSMVSVDDMPELFVSFDKLIPRPARSCEDPPLYLRLRMGKPINKKIPQSTPLMSYGKKKMRPEYWFSIPKNRVDELYRFVHAWFPHLYGELNEEKVIERGFSLVEADTELWSEEPTPSGSRHNSQGEEIAELTKESWEVLPLADEFGKRHFYGSSTPSIDIELTPPDLIGTTEILTDYHREMLCRHLPARAEGYSWTLVFSTSQHGFSLNSMYRKMYKLESPILLVIEDTDNNVFGALTSCALHVSDHFYGTGESLLFRFTPEFQVYNWTGENLYFIKGNNESLSIGAGDGKFGLWLDGDLYLGRSEKCKTYGNDPLTPKIDFVVKTLECWAFVNC